MGAAGWILLALLIVLVWLAATGRLSNVWRAMLGQ